MSEDLRDHLVADLTPVRRAGSPWLQVLVWLGVITAVTVVIAIFADLPFVLHHLMIVPDRWIAELGAALTAILAASAAFQLCRPDRSPVWSVLPLPGLALWIGASCVGIMSFEPVDAISHAVMMDAMGYVIWVICFSVPMSIVTFRLLGRGYTLYPKLTGALAGLAVSASAAALMVLIHPGDTSLVGLLVHGAAVLSVVLVSRASGRRLFRPHTTRRGSP